MDKLLSVGKEKIKTIVLEESSTILLYMNLF